jgi:integrase
MKRYRLTKTGIAALPLPERGNQRLYPDPEQPGLCVRVTANAARSFVVDKNTSRGRIRITLGPAGTDQITLPQAREQTRIALGLIAEGYTADQIKDRLARADNRIPEGAVTLNQVFEEYLAERKHKLAARTVSDYRKLLKTHLSDWQHLPLEAIDDEAVKAKFRAINSPSRANYAFRLVRALFNSVTGNKDEGGRVVVTVNPVAVLSQRAMWHRDAPKREVIKLVELPAWWRAVNALATKPKTLRADSGHFEKGTAAANSNAKTVRDFLQFLILTGLRRNEAATLKWVNLDIQSKMFTLTTTKNREPHTLPLSDFLYAMLKRRHAAALKESDPLRAGYVFAGERGPLAEPKKQIAKVVASSGVSFSSHTLRRTFASIAESLDIPYLALKRLLNHKAQDVTGKHYTVIDVERLRKPVQLITNFILRAAKAKKTAEVVKLPVRARAARKA